MEYKDSPSLLPMLGKTYVMFFYQNPFYYDFLFSRKNISIKLSLDNDDTDENPPLAILQKTATSVFRKAKLPGENRAKESEAIKSFFTDTGNYVPAEGGESIQALMERTGNFLRKLCGDASLQGKQILVSTHGAAMTALLNQIRGNLDIADFWKCQGPPNCAVTIVEVKDGVPSIMEENVIYYKEPVRAWSVE